MTNYQDQHETGGTSPLAESKEAADERAGRRQWLDFYERVEILRAVFGLSPAGGVRRALDEAHAEALEIERERNKRTRFFEVMAEIGQLQRKLGAARQAERRAVGSLLAARFAMHEASGDRKELEERIAMLAGDVPSGPLSATETDERALWTLTDRGRAVLTSQRRAEPVSWAEGDRFFWVSAGGTLRTGHLIQRVAHTLWAAHMDHLDRAGGFRTTVDESKLLSALD